MLSVNIDQLCCKLPHKRNRYCLPVDLAGGTDTAVPSRNDDLAILKRQLLRQHFPAHGRIVGHKYELDQRIVCILRHIIAKISGAERNIDRSDHDRFSGAGLSGHDI